MNIRMVALRIIGLHFLLVSATAEVSEERKEEFQKLIHNYGATFGGRSEQHFYRDWLFQLSAEERAALIPVVQQQRNEALVFGEQNQQQWNGLLAFLGDEQAMVANIEYWKGTERDWQAGRAESGQLPLYFESELFLQEEHVANWSDTGMHYRKSFLAATIVLDYLHYNKHYPQEVREWAGRTEKRVEGNMDPTLLRKVTREWYHANEGFIRAKQYDKVKPGEELPPLPRVLAEAGLGVPPTAVRKEMQDQTATTKSGVVPPPAEPESHSFMNYFIFAIAAAVFATLAFLCRNRFRKPIKQDPV